MAANAEVVLQDCSAVAGMVAAAVVTRAVLAAHPMESAEETTDAMMVADAVMATLLESVVMVADADTVAVAA